MSLTESNVLVVPEHVYGFPGSAHGGYVAGWLARRADADAMRVDFRATVPLGTPVRVTATADDCWELSGDDGPLVVARGGKPGLDLPALPT
jgi:hypothetical protein